MAIEHRSAMGKMVDMEAMRLQNEDVPAVGNMNVTAGGKPIQVTTPRHTASKPQANLTSPEPARIPVDTPVVSSSVQARANVTQQQATLNTVEAEMTETLDAAMIAEFAAAAEAVVEPTGGLQAAIAKAEETVSK